MHPIQPSLMQEEEGSGIVPDYSHCLQTRRLLKKILKLEEDEEEEEQWTKIKGKTPTSSKSKAKEVPKILEDIEQSLYPLGFSKEE